MRRSALAIVAGLMLAVLAVAFVATIFAVPLAAPVDGETLPWRLLRSVLPIAAFALPGALLAIWLAEIRRVRGLAYWIFIGALLGLIGYVALAYVPWPQQEFMRTVQTALTLLAGGALDGWVYWWIAGRWSGTLVAQLERAGRAVDLDEDGLQRRCRVCAAVMLLLGLLPLALISWHMTNKPDIPLPQALSRRAEADGTKKLANAGLSWAALKVESHIGRVVGVAPDEATRTADFEKATVALASMTGLPGVVAYLENDITVADVASPPMPVAASATGADAAAKAKELEEERLAAEAKRRAEAEAAAKAKALEDERLALEAKRKAEAEAAAAAAKATALEEERLAAEAKRKAEEDANRLALEAEAERKAVAAARKAEADRAAAQASGDANSQTTPPPLPVADPSCDADFAEAFKSTKIRFPLNGATLEPEFSGFIERVAALAKRCASYSLDIAGHADLTGSDATNLQTSLSRAVAVRDALIARGIAAARLNAKGYGDSRPLDPSRNRAAFKRNRRVELSAVPGLRAAAAAGGMSEADRARPAQPPLPAAACNTRLSRALHRSTIRFAENSTRVAARYQSALANVARVAKRCPHHEIVVNGHADRRGSADANQKLSDARAHAVRSALVDLGVPSGRLSAIGHGALLPLVRTGTKAAFACNRRVDFDVTVSAPHPQ